MSENGVRMVVGANRGIGLALTAMQLRDPRVTRVIATHRQGADLQQLALLSRQHGEKLSLHALDVADSSGLAEFAEFLKQQDGGIDVTIHAAGILHEETIGPEKSFTQCRPESLARMFQINSIGPLMTASALVSSQSRKRPFKFAALSAMVGSIGDNRLGGWYGYRASKTALNQFIKTLAVECRTRYPNASIVAIHPGTTDTDLSRPFQRGVKPGKLYTTEQTASRILRVIEAINPEQSGQFLNWDGSPIPW
jgi:NAD(P)-dependent dehydrogenase (short-subunit alcohol dehydrogenase family)